MTTSRKTTSPVKGTLPDGRRMLTIKEAAAMLGMSYWTLLDEIKAGQVPHRKGKERVLKMLWPDDIEAYLDLMRQGPEVVREDQGVA